MTAATLDQKSLDLLFADAHTTNTFTDEPVDVELIKKVYEDLRWGPTSMNTQPLRLTVLKSEEARRTVVEHLMEGNQEKTLAAPLTLVAAYDPNWHEHMPHLAPHREGAREFFADKAKARENQGRMNATIQLGYLILALRAHGLYVGPMSGLKPEGVDSAIHTENGWKTLAAINVGHAPDPGDEEAQYPRAGRLEFGQASQVL